MEARRPLDLSDWVRLAPAATRVIGSDLLVNAGGATGSVERLVGSGPELWWAFDQGLTLGEAAARLTDRTGAPPAVVEAHVLKFAAALVDARLAEPAR